MGYQPGVVYGGDVNGANGRKSAEYDLAKAVGKIESMGGTVDFLMLDGALRRTIRNGVHRQAHVSYLTIGLASVGNALRYRSLVAGSAGNGIRVGYTVAGPNLPLAVSVTGRDITVQLATDATGNSKSTAAEVKQP